VLAELLSGCAFGAREVQNREELRLILGCCRVVIKRLQPLLPDLAGELTSSGGS
jgi:hypothetical protein